MLYIELIKNIMILARFLIETLTQCLRKVVGTIKINDNTTQMTKYKFFRLNLIMVKWFTDSFKNHKITTVTIVTLNMFQSLYDHFKSTSSLLRLSTNVTVVNTILLIF
jgi:hypothetical protein